MAEWKLAKKKRAEMRKWMIIHHNEFPSWLLLHLLLLLIRWKCAYASQVKVFVRLLQCAIETHQWWWLENKASETVLSIKCIDSDVKEMMEAAGSEEQQPSIEIRGNCWCGLHCFSTISQPQWMQFSIISKWLQSLRHIHMHRVLLVFSFTIDMSYLLLLVFLATTPW